MIGMYLILAIFQEVGPFLAQGPFYENLTPQPKMCGAAPDRRAIRS